MVWSRATLEVQGKSMALGSGGAEGAAAPPEKNQGGDAFVCYNMYNVLCYNLFVCVQNPNFLVKSL